MLAVGSLCGDQRAPCAYMDVNLSVAVFELFRSDLFNSCRVSWICPRVSPSRIAVQCKSALNQFVQDSEICISVSLVWLEVATFSPFIPGIDKQELIIRCEFVFCLFYRSVQKIFECAWIVVDECDRRIFISRCIIP